MGPIAGAVAGQVVPGFEIAAAVAVSGLLLMPAFLILDEDRPWWSDELRRLAQDKERARPELRKLTVWSVIALLSGIAIALIRPWA